MPFSAPLPVPTIIEVGEPSAHGQAIISTNSGNQRHRDVAHDVEPDDKVAIAIAIPQAQTIVTWSASR